MKIVFEVESLSHRVSEAAFEIIPPASEFGMQVRCIAERRFIIEVDGDSLLSVGSESVEFHAYKMASMFLMALNLATAGYFWWADQVRLDPFYRVVEGNAVVRLESLSQTRSRAFEQIKDLLELQVHNALVIWGALVRDKDQENWRGYQKGLLLLTAEHFDLDFHRDAFLHFYRCVESFVTQKILGVPRLNNELRQIQQALAQVGAEDLQNEFREIYALRSSQVAHAQNVQRAISFDEAIVAKCFADMLMYKTYRREAEAMRRLLAAQVQAAGGAAI